MPCAGMFGCVYKARGILLSIGRFSVSVPNARLYLEAYIDQSRDISHFVVYKPAFKNTENRIDFYTILSIWMDITYICLMKRA